MGRLVASYALVVLGMLNVVGYVSGVKRLSRIAGATAAATLPIIFVDMRGLEPFPLRADLEVVTVSGARRSEAMTRAVFSRLRGPFSRRHAYLRLIAEGPRKRQAFRDSVLRYGFCHDGPLAKEFGIAEPIREATIHLTSTTAGRGDRWDLTVACPP